MKVKIDTKEKFHVISIEERILSANMTEDIRQMLLPYLDKENKNVILKFGFVESIEDTAAKTIFDVQQTFYSSNASFVICELKKSIEEVFDKQELLDILNFTPTESEAWDIVQMEEIEREFLD